LRRFTPKQLPQRPTRRTTTREVEIQCRTIPNVESLSLMWIAANRDPRAFDDPNAVKSERSTGTSLVRGQGIHLCLGAPLATLEMRVAPEEPEELLSRTKRVEFAGEAPHRAGLFQ